MRKDAGMSGKVVLTGIKPTGMPHLGNYLGAIKPALELAKSYEARYFIADYHSLNSIKDPKLLKSYTYEIAVITSYSIHYTKLYE